MGALVTGAKPGTLAVRVVVPGAMPVNVTPLDSQVPAGQEPVAPTVAAEGTELVKVTERACAEER